MRISRETLKTEADALRQRAEPIWAALENIQGREFHQRAFDSSLMLLEQQRLCITVVGEFNTGKSTLLNAFIGDERLPTDQLECTAVPTWVWWADDESRDENRQATVIRVNGRRDTVPLDEVSAHTTLGSDSWEEIERVEITLLDERERGLTDVMLVDTPGLNGNEELEARSIHQLGMSHVTIVVVPVDGIGRESDVELIKKARSIADRVMVVINKCDKYAKTGDGFEKLRNELRRLVPDLPREAIYTISAKCAFDDNAYRYGEDELKSEFYRFRDDLRKNVLEDLATALKKRPLLLLREICKKEIARIERLEAECDTSIVEELEAAKAHLEEASVNLKRSQQEVLEFSRKMLMEEVYIFRSFLDAERSHIQEEMTKFVDELDEELLNRDDLRAARQRVSSWLNERMQSSIYNRVAGLLKAAANRLTYDLKSRRPDFTLNLSKEASIEAPLEQQADKSIEALSRHEDEIDRLKREFSGCEQAVKVRETEMRRLQKESVQLENLEAKRKKAVRDRRKLGLKPAPEEKICTTLEEREVWRGGFWGGIMDRLRGPKIEKVPVQRIHKDYSRVKEWERKYEEADKKVLNLDRKIKPLKAKRAELQKIQNELPKLQREADNTKAKLKHEEARRSREEERYRQAKIKTRQVQLKSGARRELESLFDSLPKRLEQEAEEMLKRISADFSRRFEKAADRQRKLLEDKMASRKKKAYEADAERVKREDIRKRLEEELETLPCETQGERT